MHSRWERETWVLKRSIRTERKALRDEVHYPTPVRYKGSSDTGIAVKVPCLPIRELSREGGFKTSRRARNNLVEHPQNRRHFRWGLSRLFETGGSISTWV
jgi:hypothetical protein